MKKTLTVTLVITCLMLASVHGQTVSGKTIPYKAKKALLGVMEDCEVSSVTITSTARSVDDQVKVMFRNIERTSPATQKREYSKYGDAVIQKYEDGKAAGKSDYQIKQMMADELERQLPGAKRNNKLNHVSGSDLIVFDIGMRSIKSSGNSSNDFENCLRKSRKFYRVLVEPQNNCIHVEMRK